MAYSTIGVVVEKSRDNLVFVTEIQTGRSFVVTDKAAKAYQSGDILTLNLTTKTFVRCDRRLSICLGGNGHGRRKRTTRQ
ncbi:tRNA pseudouridine synthase D [Enterococcus faecium]|nr:tRNA pseudouridine synthase D [Enterococcus faecium]